MTVKEEVEALLQPLYDEIRRLAAIVNRLAEMLEAAADGGEGGDVDDLCGQPFLPPAGPVRH